MGTDIHTQVEVRRNGQWEWVGKFLPSYISPMKYQPFDIWRNYYLFTKLAGVRKSTTFSRVGSEISYLEAKGLPDDIDPDLLSAIRTQVVDLGDHSYSYLDGLELSNLELDRNKVDIETIYRLQNLRELTRGLIDHKDIRIVFGFDN